MASITSANAVLIITIRSLYPTPQQIQGFSADDIYDVDALEIGETMMGVDGVLSAGWVNVSVKQGISLQADSVSNVVFDTWYTTEQQLQDKLVASASITLTSIGKKYNMGQGYLTTYKPIADGKKVLQPRKHILTWQSIIPAPITTA
jgi:hypothetical protein